MGSPTRSWDRAPRWARCPTLYAATVPDLPGGSFVGPDGFLEQRGYPHRRDRRGRAYDEDAWRRLWEVSEELTGVHYEFSRPRDGLTAPSCRRGRGARMGGPVPRARRSAAGAGAGRARERSARRLPATRPRSPSRSRRCCATSTRCCSPDHPLAAPALLRVLRDDVVRTGDPGRAVRRDAQLDRRSCGGPRPRRRSSRASCSTGWRSCSGCPTGGTGTSRTPPRPRRSPR